MRTLLAVAAVAVFSTACQSTVPAPAAGQIDHVVLVWLKEPGNEAVRQRLIAEASTFPDRIPGILSLSAGAPLSSDRPVVDDTFDVGFVMRFVDREALAAYEVHPVHQAAVTNVLAPAAQRFVVYDVLVR
jgi:hypothetical protein